MIAKSAYAAILGLFKRTARSNGSSTYYGFFDREALDADNLDYRFGGHACFSEFKHLPMDKTFAYGSNIQPDRKFSGRGSVFQCDKEASLAFVAFITDPVESPWRDFAHILFSDPYTNEERTFLGMVVESGDIPCNVLVNFFKAHRMLGEYPSRVYLWHELVKAGVKPRNALALCTMFDVNDLRVFLCDASHSFVNTGGHKELFTRLVNQDMNRDMFGPMFNDPKLKYPLFLKDAIWSPKKDYMPASQNGFLDGLLDRLKKKIGKRIYTDPFTGSQTDLEGYYSFENVKELNDMMCKEIGIAN